MDAVSRYFPSIKNASYEAYVCVASTLTRTDLRIHVASATSFAFIAAAFALIGQLYFCTAIMCSMTCMIPVYKLDVLFRCKVKYSEELERKFITPQRIAELEKQVATHNYRAMVNLINAVIEDSFLADLMQKARLMPWFLSQVEILVVNKAIDLSLASKLHSKLAENNVFYHKNHAVSLISSGRIPLAINKYALLLLSPIYQKQRETTDPAWLSIPKVRFHAIELFDQFLTHNKFEWNLTATLEDVVDLLNLAKHFEMKRLEDLALGIAKEKLIQNIKNVYNEETLEHTLKLIDSYHDTIDDEEWCSKAKYQAVTNFSSRFFAYPDNFVPFQLDENCFNIPAKLLHLTLGQGLKAELFKTANCLTIDNTQDGIKNRLRLYPGGLNKFESLCFVNQRWWTKDSFELFTSISEQFTKLKKIYTCIDGSFDCQLLNRLRESVKLPLHIFFHNNLLDIKKSHTISISDNQEFCKLIKDVNFVNLSPNIEFIVGPHGRDNILRLLNEKHKIEGHVFKEKQQHYGNYVVYLAPIT